MNNQRRGDGKVDDGIRIFRAYEQRRVATIGGRPARTTPPTGIYALWRELGGTADAWKKVEQYGKRAIELCQHAIDTHDARAQDKIAWRADGNEWSSNRYRVVMAWQGNGAEPPKPAPPPEPDPVVDGTRVDRHEREAWDAGGEDAVRKQRASALSFDRLGELAAGFLRDRRGVG